MQRHPIPAWSAVTTPNTTLLDPWLEYLMHYKATDLHVSAGSVPRVRIDGKLFAITDPATGRWAIEDQGSTNGTVVNHQRLNAPMIPGARGPVRIGATTFELR